MSLPPQSSVGAGERPGSGTSKFGLTANAFAILGATPRTPNAELQELAACAATPAAAAAARLAAVPRSRLGAEVSFLPGAADAAPALAHVALSTGSAAVARLHAIPQWGRLDGAGSGRRCRALDPAAPVPAVHA